MRVLKIFSYGKPMSLFHVCTKPIRKKREFALGTLNQTGISRGRFDSFLLFRLIRVFSRQ